MLQRALRDVIKVLTALRPSASATEPFLFPRHMPMEAGHNHGLPGLPPRMMFSSTAEDHQTGKKSLYVVNVEGKRTLGPLLIGLMDYFERWVPNVGFFQVSLSAGALESYKTANNSVSGSVSCMLGPGHFCYIAEHAA